MSRASPSNAKALGQTRANAGTGDHEGRDDDSTDPLDPVQLDLLGYRPRFDGAHLRPVDHIELRGNLDLVRRTLKRHGALTIEECQLLVSKDYAVHMSATSVAARIRDLRKAKFGGRQIICRRRGDSRSFEYELIERSA